MTTKFTASFWVGIAATLLCVASAAAAPFEILPISATLSETVTHDDNVFRAPSTAGPVADTIASSSIRVSIDKELSRQRLQAAVSLSDNRYQRLHALNNVSSSYLLGWQGSFPSQWTTDASWTRARNLVNFADVRATSTKDVVTADAARFRLGYTVHSDWPVYVQRAHTDVDNSAATLAFNNYTTDSTEFGLQYNSPLGNQASLLRRKTDGNYPNLPAALGNEFRQDDLQAAIQWKPGPISAISLQLGRTHRTQPNLPQRDFSGVTGRLNAEWVPSPMTSINASVGREVSPITAVSAQSLGLANYALVRSYGLGARWAATPKVSAEAKVGRQLREFSGVQTDVTTSGSIIMRYAPAEVFQVALQFSHEVRNSTNSALVLPYTSNVGILTLTLSF